MEEILKIYKATEHLFYPMLKDILIMWNKQAIHSLLEEINVKNNGNYKSHPVEIIDLMQFFMKKL